MLNKKEQVSDNYWERARLRTANKSRKRHTSDRLAFSRHNMFRRPASKLTEGNILYNVFK